MYTVTGLTGPAGCSKTTVAELIRDYLADDPSKIIAIDTSKCLENSRKYNTAAGKELLKMVEDQNRGIVLPGTPVVNSILENFEWISQYVTPFHFILAGSTRSVEEAQEIMKYMRQGILSFRVAHIRCTYAEVEQGVQNRVLKGTIRADSGPTELKKRWEEYNVKTIPSLDVFRKELVVHTSRAKPLIMRLRDVVNHMEVRDNVRKRWLRKLDERSHPIHEAIRAIEANKAARATVAPPCENISHQHPLVYASEPQQAVYA